MAFLNTPRNHKENQTHRENIIQYIITLTSLTYNQYSQYYTVISACCPQCGRVPSLSTVSPTVFPKTTVTSTISYWLTFGSSKADYSDTCVSHNCH